MTQNKPALLYHATAAVIDGGVLKATHNKSLAGIEGNFVFAVDDLRMAYAYALKQDMKAKGIPRMRSCLALKRTPCVFMEDKHLLPHLPAGTIYLLPNDSFEQVVMADGFATSEYVSPADIHLSEVERISGIKPDMVMEKGVQIFFLHAEHFPDGNIAPFMAECRTGAADGDAAVIAGLNRLLATGKISHLNAERGINPHYAYSSSADKDAN